MPVIPTRFAHHFQHDADLTPDQLAELERIADLFQKCADGTRNADDGDPVASWNQFCSDPAVAALLVEPAVSGAAILRGKLERALAAWDGPRLSNPSYKVRTKELIGEWDRLLFRGDLPPRIRDHEIRHRGDARRLVSALLRRLDRIEGRPIMAGGEAAPAPTHAAPPTREPDYLLRKEGKVWHLKYGTEEGHYPAGGNQALAWLPALLTKPNRLLTVADLRGDPDGKLAADTVARVGRPLDGKARAAALREIDKVAKEIDDIETTAGEVGWTESQEERKARLLTQLQALKRQAKGPAGRRFASGPVQAHHNVTTQLRSLFRKLRHDMPALAAHLHDSLKMDFPKVGYFPPGTPPDWKS